MTSPLAAPRAATDAWGAWDRFLAGHPETSFHQSSWWAQAHRTPESRGFGLLVRQHGILHGGAIALRETWGPGRAAYRIVDGPVLPADPALAEEAFKAMLASLQRRRRREPALISHLRIESRWNDLPEFVRSFAPITVGPRRLVASIDLASSETSILARMAPAVRARIAIARQLGVRVIEDAGERGIDALLRLSEEATAPPGPEVLQLLPYLRLPGRGGIFFVEDGEERLAGAAIVTFGNQATLLHSVARDPAGQGPTPTFLQFEMMRRAKARHCHHYDLTAPAGRTDALDGLGGEIRRFIPAIDIVFDTVSYASFSGVPPEAGGLW